MIYRKWQIPTSAPAQIQTLARQLDTSPLVAQVLAARGCKDAAAALAMYGQGVELSDPMLMQDMDKLVQRVHRAVDHGEKIVVYGDYDVDGVTATALMLAYLESIGATVFYKLPSREGDGYGLSKEVIDLLVRKNVSLLLTVDNGISAMEECAYAAEKGLDVIVTDHHLPQQQLPAALAVVDPLRADDTSPAKNLSGVGVAFKVICALEGCPPEELLPFYGDLVAVGTVADMMNLTGENRTLVLQGLECLASTQHVGLAALLRHCGLEDKPLTADNVSYTIGPRMNAAGRMEDATAALQLLLTEDEEEAEALVEQLNDYNVQRQAIEQEMVNELVARIEADPAHARRPVLVVWGQGYHQGVIGIVASRLLERYGKPAIVCTVDEQGLARGSCRSFEGFSLHAALTQCADLLERYGGHEQAAGLSIRMENMPVFIERINQYAATCRVLHPALQLDGIYRPAETTVADVEQLALLAPYGCGNPTPQFLLPTARIEGVYPVSEGRHVRLRLVSNGASVNAVLFGTSPAQLAYRVGDVVDAVLTVSVFSSAGGDLVSSRIRALRPAALGEDYLPEWELYNRFVSGGSLTRQEKALLCPAREDVIRVFREVGAGGITTGDLRPMLLRCAGPGGKGAGKLLVALDVLQELNHVAPVADGAVLAHTGGARRPLTESALLKDLEE